MIWEKTLLAALLRQLEASHTATQDNSDQTVDLMQHLPNTSERQRFLHRLNCWKQPFGTRLTVEQMTALHQTTTLPMSELVDYFVHRLNISDANNTFEPPNVQQVAWVFEKLRANSAEGGTFRALIYGEMGFDESAYGTLWKAGGLDINNALMRDDPDEAPANK